MEILFKELVTDYVNHRKTYAKHHTTIQKSLNVISPTTNQKKDLDYVTNRGYCLVCESDLKKTRTVLFCKICKNNACKDHLCKICLNCNNLMENNTQN